MTKEILSLDLDSIAIGGGTQARVEINQSAVAEYAEFILADGELPPVIVFEDGVQIWLADGFHRYHAHRKAQQTHIQCEVRSGTQRDAQLFAAGANASHGLRRTNDDKRKSVMMLLSDAEWSAWSQEKIAKECGVSTGFVSKLINDPSLHREEMGKSATRTVERNGKTYEQNTANIGAKQKSTGLNPIPSVFDPVPFPVTPADEALIGDSDEPTASLADAYDEMTIKHDLLEKEVMRLNAICESDDKLAASMAELTKQTALVVYMKQQADSKQGEYKARADAVTYWKGQAEKEKKRADRAEKEVARLTK
ncbi:ParB/RepB/Spo0J family partition protein [Glaciimonas immobilis]|uniref:ParB-like N-terminal domain-containing protein n=1 Tax=Glaciimonas immobilis TaxID=728004 RepID=A0A840RWG0_9BURK|nr:ParB/RepB/Spo0J family partition protein [Glaciimonas immobilis]KAF3997518.1 ParB N-terminal domain-containing protein [Glaciimonas immobilis]MBB5200800.1 hypothetical protein [Glaciimonas immobilis]